MDLLKEHGTSLLAGSLFALGLALSGMTQPDKVVGFLDVFGDWDPSLAFVMGGAVLVHSVAYLVAGRLAGPLLVPGARWTLPRRQDVDARLLGGAALFGVGWGLSGYCPGPALVAAPTLSTEVIVFLPAMLVGMVAYERVDLWWTQRRVAALNPG